MNRFEINNPLAQVGINSHILACGSGGTTGRLGRGPCHGVGITYPHCPKRCSVRLLSTLPDGKPQQDCLGTLLVDLVGGAGAAPGQFQSGSGKVGTGASGRLHLNWGYRVS